MKRFSTSHQNPRQTPSEKLGITYSPTVPKFVSIPIILPHGRSVTLTGDSAAQEGNRD